MEIVIIAQSSFREWSKKPRAVHLISEELGSSPNHISPGFYVRWTGIHFVGRTSVGYFYRGGIGVTYETNDFDAGALDTDFRESINTELQVGAGVFGDLDLPLMESRIFLGVSIPYVLKSQIIDFAKSYSHNPRLLAELGIDVKMSRSHSVFLMVSSPLNKWGPNYHVGFKVY